VPRKNDFHFFLKSHNGGYWVNISKNFEKFVGSFFTYSQGTHSKGQPLELLRSSDQPFSKNKNLKFAKIKTLFFVLHDINRLN